MEEIKDMTIEEAVVEEANQEVVEDDSIIEKMSFTLDNFTGHRVVGLE